MNQQVAWWVALGLAGLLSGCALAPGAKPEDMSTEAHEEQEVKHAQIAQKHAAQAHASVLSKAETHNIQAERHLLHAEDHRVAAEALREAEEDACESVPPGVRESCPLLGPVVSTEATANGASITVRPGTDMKTLVAHIRCHIAVGKTQGRKGMEHCPLYARGVDIQQVGPNTIELTTSGHANIRELQDRVATQIGD